MPALHANHHQGTKPMNSPTDRDFWFLPLAAAGKLDELKPLWAQSSLADG